MQNELEKSAINQYLKAIEEGKEVVSHKVAEFYKYLVKDLKNPESKYFYSKKKAKHAVDFIERFCKHSKGKWRGKPVKLELWQKAFIESLFGVLRKDNKFRRFKRAILFVARKNGKSLLVSAIGNYCFTADGEGGAECYSVATQREQAKIIWNESRSMIKKSPALSKRVKCLVGSMHFYDNVYKPLASDSNSLDGLNTHFAGLDEIHAWKDQNLYDVVLNSISAREQPILLIISTMGTVRELVFDDVYNECERIITGYSDGSYSDDTVLPLIYELDKRAEWTDPAKWKKANPNLGVSKSFEYLETEVNKAKADNKRLKNTLCKDFNIRETSSEAWLSFEEADNTATFNIFELKPDYAIIGADLSRTTDLTAAGLLFGVKQKPGELFYYPMFWLPEDLLEKHVVEDKVPYDIWKKNGFLRTCYGNKIDTDDIIEWLEELHCGKNGVEIYYPYGGYDAWSASEWVKKLKQCFGDVFEPVRQGKQTLSLPMNLLGADLARKKINYGNNPILKWCLTNTRADIDKNGNMQPAKTLNAKQRIDGTAALLNAYTVYLNHLEEYQNMIW